MTVVEAEAPSGTPTPARRERGRSEAIQLRELLRALRLAVAITLPLAASASVAFAAEPSLKHMFPAAGARGNTITVRPVGKFTPWPVKAWVDAPGITFKPLKQAGEFDVEIAPDAALGPHLVRFFNDDGASQPRFLIVSEKPDVLEAEPNDDFTKPQKIAGLPAAISGKLDKSGDVDCFAVALKKGETLTASLEAYVLMSTFDGLLRIVDERGGVLAFNHDGRTLDPLLRWTAPRDGTFIVQAMGFVYPATADVRLTGSEGCVYRLRLASGEKLATAGGTAETEPNNTADKAQSLTLPGEIAGRIDPPGDEDRFAFAAAKGRAYEFALTAARDGSPLDAWLAIESKDGKQLSRADDSDGSRDPKLTWTATGDGPFTVAIGDLTHRGGAAFTYRLRTAEAAPGVAGSATADSFVLKADKPGEAKVSVKRTNGFKAKLKLAAKNLPEGVSAPEVDVPDKDGEVTLKLSATPEAKAASQPIQLVLRESDSGAEHVARYFLTKSAEDNGVPQGYTALVIDSTDQLWLTVIAAPPKPDAPKPPEPAKPAATATAK